MYAMTERPNPAGVDTVYRVLLKSFKEHAAIPAPQLRTLTKLFSKDIMDAALEKIKAEYNVGLYRESGLYHWGQYPDADND